ncbi:MAG: hypothetical protein LVR00_04415 [Rhabdochlamydiaceae bacterium]|jgi:predicted metalloprotease with PDZ domain
MGRGLYDSFSICANDYWMQHPQEMVHTISHEHFHTWNGIKMPPADPKSELFWFTEGFTEYYTHKLNQSAGVITQEEYVEKMNAIIHKYFTSPAKKYSNSQVAKEFKADNKVWDIDYFRGALLAACWDREIQLRMQGIFSLDNVMLLLRHKTNGKEVTKKAIIECAALFLQERAGYEVQHYLMEGNEIILPQDLFGPAYILKWVKAGAVVVSSIYQSDSSQFIPQFVKKPLDRSFAESCCQFLRTLDFSNSLTFCMLAAFPKIVVFEKLISNLRQSNCPEAP